MKMQAIGIMVALSLVAGGARLSAQEKPAKAAVAEQFLHPQGIHKHIGKLYLQGANNSWSQKQCISCHQSAHNLLHEGTVHQGQVLLSLPTVANSLGIEPAPLDGTLRAHLNIDEKSGLVLSSVPEGSEGAKAGLKAHDVVLNIDQHSVNEPAQFNELLGTLAGKKARFGLLRHGKPLSLEIDVPQMPLMAVDMINEHMIDIGWSDNRYRIGVSLSEADETLRSHLKLPAGEGLVVTEVMPDSPAAKMGVKQHDVLIELAGKRLTTIDALNTQIQEIQDKSVLLRLLRSGQEVTCQIAPKKSNEQMQALREWVLVKDQPHHQAVVRWWDATGALQSGSADKAGAASQLAELKKQLAAIAKTVEKLEAAIPPPAAAPEKQPQEPPKKE